MKAAEESEDVPSNEADPLRMRLTKIDRQELFKRDVHDEKKPKKYYEALARTLSFKEIKELAADSIKARNVSALDALAQSNVYAVTAALDEATANYYFNELLRDGDSSNFIPRMYFMIKANAPEYLHELLKRLTRISILKSSLSISGKGLRGNKRTRVRYEVGMPEFDLNYTLMNYMNQGLKPLRYEDIIGISRTEIKKTCVLMLDTSGSMFGALLLNAALTTAVLSYAMRDDKTSIILFAQDAYVMKHLNQPLQITGLIDDVLDLEAVGFTNISAALYKGLKELRTVNSRNKFGILISDGQYNRGGNPLKWARKFPQLHVLGMPSSSKSKGTRGLKLCQQMAEVANGNYIPVESYQEIPRTLMRLLSRL